MEDKAFNIVLDKNPIISIKVIPGHFTTANLHVNYYLDVSTLKSNAMVARDVGRELALPYLSSTLVDTIVCMENTKVIGAYLAEELLGEGTAVMNSGGEIHVVTPMQSDGGNLVFYDSEVDWITNKNILVLTATISSGTTLRSALDCLAFYNGRIAGISALFMQPNEDLKYEINTLFSSDDIPGYNMYRFGQCEMCNSGHKLDALISSEGFTKMELGGRKND